jgi:hypothetical protein
VFLFGVSCAVISVLSKDTISPVLIAFTLQSLTDMMPLVSLAIRMGSEFENYMTSSQQIYGYTKMISEGNLKEPADEELAENWPE